jgi:hypothetical protein
MTPGYHWKGYRQRLGIGKSIARIGRPRRSLIDRRRVLLGAY